NGLLDDPTEECDGTFCRGSCASPDGAFVTTCEEGLLHCAANCRIDRSGCPATTTSTTTTTSRSTTTRTTSTTTSTTTATTLAPNQTPKEICGDCIDNDHNELTDFEDPA